MRENNIDVIVIGDSGWHRRVEFFFSGEEPLLNGGDTRRAEGQERPGSAVRPQCWNLRSIPATCS